MTKSVTEAHQKLGKHIFLAVSRLRREVHEECFIPYDTLIEGLIWLAQWMPDNNAAQQNTKHLHSQTGVDKFRRLTKSRSFTKCIVPIQSQLTVAITPTA